MAGFAGATMPTLSLTSPQSGYFNGDISVVFVITDSDDPGDVNISIAIRQDVEGGMEGVDSNYVYYNDTNLMEDVDTYIERLTCTSPNISSGATCTYTLDSTEVDDANYMFDLNTTDSGGDGWTVLLDGNVMIDNTKPYTYAD